MIIGILIRASMNPKFDMNKIAYDVMFCLTWYLLHSVDLNIFEQHTKVLWRNQRKCTRFYMAPVCFHSVTMN